MINRPALLLADEPTNDLDEQAEAEVLTLLQELHKSSATTLIVVTHDPGLAGTGRPRGHPPFEGDSSRLDDPPRSLPRFRILFRPPAATTWRTRLLSGWGATDRSRTSRSPWFRWPRHRRGRALPDSSWDFSGWVAVAVGVLSAARPDFGSVSAAGDRAAGRRGKKSEQLAMQQLRADIHDVVYLSEGQYEVTVYLENFAPDQPFFVLGPELARSFRSTTVGNRSRCTGPDPTRTASRRCELAAGSSPSAFESTPIATTS